jgi:hypothetical protein
MNRRATGGRAGSKRGERGQEMLEFTLVTWLLLVPMFLGMITLGLNLVRSNQVTFITGDMATMYIQGQDFSTYAMQNMAARLATGLNLQIGSSFSGNNATNTSTTTGSVIVTMTKLLYVGTVSQATCLSVGSSTSGNCKNHDSFVYLQRIAFGNGSLATAPTSIAGTPSSSIVINSSGTVSNYLTDINAQIPASADTAMDNLWSPGSANGLQDGQTIYLVETYFESTGFSFGNGTKGVYAKYFY